MVVVDKDYFKQFEPDFIIKVIFSDNPITRTFDNNAVLVAYNGSSKEVSIPNGINQIGESFNEGNPLFYNLSRGTVIKIPKTVKFIGSRAFAGCKSDIRVPHVDFIYEEAFKGCTGNIILDGIDNTTMIASKAFEGCSGLTSLPDSITSVPEETFINCINLKKLPNNLVKASHHAFEGCTSLTSIPETLQVIGVKAFANCIGLKEITIGKNIHYVADNAFENCPLERINIDLETRNLPEGLYHSNNLKHYHVNGVPLVKFYGTVNFSRQNTNWVYSVDIGDKRDNRIIRNIINGMPREGFKKIFWDNIDVDNLKKVIKDFSAIGISEEDITSLIINRPILLKYNLDTMIENFKYLDEQKIIPSTELNKLFFDCENIDLTKEGVTVYLKEYYSKNQCLPELFQRLACAPDDNERLELRDNLLYVSGMQLLSNVTPQKMQKVKRMLNRTEYENIIEEDNERYKKEIEDNDNYLEFNGIYDEYFDGVKTSFYHKLSGISPKFFEQLINSMEDKNANSDFNKFMRSLYIIKSNNWYQYAPKERATILKNEIVSRLLYTSIVLTFDENFELPKDKENKIKFYTLLKENMDKLDFSEVLKKASDSSFLYKNDKYIKMMLQIDPYSFDAFRGNDFLEARYCIDARENGYLFDKEQLSRLVSIVDAEQKKITDQIKDFYNGNNEGKDIQELKSLSSIFTKTKKTLLNSYNYNDTHLFEFLNNKIGIPKLPTKDNKEYLKRIEIIMNKYLNDSDTNDLNDFLRLVDFYMRSNCEDVLQYSKRDEIEKTSKKVFDTNSEIPNHDRLLYSLYNLNKLAHSINEKQLKIDLIDKRLIDTEEEYKNLVKVIKSINELIDNGISLEETLNFLGIEENKKTDLHEKLTNKLEIGNINTLKKILLDGIYLIKTPSLNKRIITYFKEQKDVSERDSIKYKNIDSIKENLRILIDLKNKNILNNTNVEKIKLLSSQRKLFFSAKKVIAEELLKKNLKELDIKSFVNMSLKEKQDFYDKNGYIIEIQRQPIRDENNNIKGMNPILVCYSKTYKESFSVHLVGLSKDVESVVNKYINSDKYEATISNTMLSNPGLTLRDSEIDLEKLKETELITKPGFSSAKQEYSTTLYNYIKFDLHSKINSVDTITNDNVKEWFKGFKIPNKKIDLVKYIKDVHNNTITLKSKLSISESVSNVLKKLHLNLGMLPNISNQKKK